MDYHRAMDAADAKAAARERQPDPDPRFEPADEGLTCPRCGGDGTVTVGHAGGGQWARDERCRQCEGKGSVEEQEVEDG